MLVFLRVAVLDKFYCINFIYGAKQGKKIHLNNLPADASHEILCLSYLENTPNTCVLHHDLCGLDQCIMVKIKPIVNRNTYKTSC